METYNFTEWSDWRLNEKLTDMLETRDIRHGEQRMAEQARFLSHLVFEINERLKDERA